MGGGYVLSGDVARTLVGVNRAMRLKFTPIEDATLGFWLMAMDLRHVDHERFYTWAASCCFETLEHDKDKDGEQRTKVKVMDAVVDDLCTDDPWLVLHKIDSPTKMRALGDEARRCGPTPPLESIARAGGGQPWRPPGRSGGGGGGGGGGNGGNGGGDAGSAAEVEAAAERGTGVGAGGSLSDDKDELQQQGQPEGGSAEGQAAASVADSAAAAADAAAADAAAAVKEAAAKAAAGGDGGGR